MNWSVPHYLDASVASKIFTKEDRWRVIDTYVRENDNYHFWITEFVYYEILNVLKQQWQRNQISLDRYHSGIYELNSCIDEGLIQIDDDVDVKDLKHHLTIREIVNVYKIDYSDALQLITVLEGRWKNSVYECKTVFVSADSDLVEAARSLKMRVWHFGKEKPPTIAQQDVGGNR